MLKTQSTNNDKDNMTRLIGINLPDDKRIEYALTLIYGIGPNRAKLILKECGIELSTRVKDMNDDDVKKLQDFIEKTYKVEGDLKEEINANIKRYREIGSYRGIRHSRGLPVNGQRTKSNARTKRGKRKTVGALKKEDAAKVAAK